MPFHFSSIGVVRTETDKVPRHWSVSDVEGRLEILPEYTEGLKDIEAGQQIVVLFNFHRSPPFNHQLLTQTPPHQDSPKGVFSICSPRRPNAIGMSVLQVLSRKDNVIRVRGLDMYDGTPILDLKPYTVKP